MDSLDELFSTIMSIPFVDVDVKVRAGYLRSQLFGRGRGYHLFNLFGH
ncbi:MAG: hypothetical protein U5N53_09010 [Mycobacterium sp.]|nr:hypothetical protein [Mycobacterium sp.]